jgi:hypothetical protein
MRPACFSVVSKELAIGVQAVIGAGSFIYDKANGVL